MSRVEDIERRGRCTAVHPDQSVDAAARAMSLIDRAGVPVVEAGRLVGLLTERDVLRKVVAAGRSPARVRVRDVMSTDFAVARPGDSCRDCLARMADRAIRVLPVVDGADRLVGMISLVDVLRAEVEDRDETLYWMGAYLEFVPPERD